MQDGLGATRLHPRTPVAKGMSPSWSLMPCPWKILPAVGGSSALPWAASRPSQGTAPALRSLITSQVMDEHQTVVVSQGGAGGFEIRVGIR